MKPRYFVLTLLLATTIVALILAGVGLFRTIWLKQLEETAFRQRIASLEQKMTDLRSRHEDEFVGVHPAPIVLIDPHVEKANPWIFRIRPSRYNGSGGKYWIGAPGDDSPKLREIDFDLRLLRSLDDIDFFRIVHRVDGQSVQQILFEYDGNPKLLYASDSISFVIAPNAKACMDVAINARKPAEHSRLADSWITGDYQPYVQNANPRGQSVKK
ncbi:hypothetical protein [Allorhodopirellula solitaria]|uniref:Uncharacterized protein n=1 Tax=Allorhodopirellula solitaria TaxID=2527987 RepID=A0A5C5X230_9BACT|nr:hypothetical protein [Allorhodopirellula solitaria]TWT56292.1 hypothetical protein CA85_42930 [Allorhodopirellula solitaria]